MGGSIKLLSYSESNPVVFDTGYGGGLVDATGLNLSIKTGGGKVFVGLSAVGYGYINPYSNLLVGSDPTFVVTSESAVAGASSWTIVSNGGTTPTFVPILTRSIDYTLSSTRWTVFGYGGTGIGTDSTFYWQHAAGRRIYFSVQNLLTVDSAGTWGMDILRTTNSVTTAPYQYLNDTKVLSDVLPVSGFRCIDNPPAGTHSYKVRFPFLDARVGVLLYNVKLVAYEL